MEEEKIRVGVSSCLLGVKVRWNGDHKQDRYLTDVLGRYFEWVPVCPEFETGMGVPRETVRLVNARGGVKMLGTASGRDWTEKMTGFSKRKTSELETAGLSAFIFKKGSPSCGLERVKVYNAAGMPAEKGTGLFAGAFKERFPLIPLEEEGRLHDAAIRENFIVRVFCYARLQKLLAAFSAGALVKFHTAHKYLIMAHSVKHYQSLGRLVAEAKKIGAAEARRRYAALFMEALSFKATARKNANVLMHMLGYLRPLAGKEEKEDILQAVEDYRTGLVPLIVPVTLLSHYIRKFRIEYLLDQVYLNPHPKELMLRNHV